MIYKYESSELYYARILKCKLFAEVIFDYGNDLPEMIPLAFLFELYQQLSSFFTVEICKMSTLTIVLFQSSCIPYEQP